MKKILLSTICILTVLSLSAQQQTPCGFVENQAFMDRVAYLKSQAHLDKTEAANDTLPLAIHLVANDAGNGRQKITQLFENICTLNEQYADAGIYFFIQWPINYIDNTTYYNHTGTAGQQMMYSYKRSNALNLFFVGDPNGACGYYSYGPDCIALSNSCSKDDNTTMAHELGHLLGLPHTFRGWEHGNIPNNPELVTRGAGANCSSRGDLFCDTDADYISYRWSCPFNGVKYDANGDKYRQDSSWYMSYSSDVCQSRFSPEQIQVMRADKASRWSFLDKVFASPVANFSAIQLNNFNDTLYNNKTISWDAIPGANAYYIQLNFQNLPHYALFDTVIQQTSITLPFNFTDGSNYAVRVMPVNNTSLCGELPEGLPFVYSNTDQPTEPTSLDGLEEGDFSYTLSTNENRLHIRTESKVHFQSKLEVFNTLGQRLLTEPLDIRTGQHSTLVELNNIHSGIFIATITIGEQKLSQKFIVF